VINHSVGVVSRTAVAFTGIKMSQLCRYCDVLPSTCQNTGTCNPSCNVTTICEEDEICAGIWWSEGGNVTVKVLCHNPARPLYGMMLNDYSNSQCVMMQ
ncbi:hypothetical protein NFI96_019332, partial [Prochilodus magdalenae]